MRFLRKPFDYASAGVYVAPTKVWDGQPRIVEMSDSQLIAGATPDTPLPSEYENHRNKIMSDGQYLQAHSALQSWDSLTIPQVGTDSYVCAVGMRRIRAYGTMTEAQRQVILFGADAADSKPRVCLSNDGNRLQLTPTKFTIGGPFLSPTYAYPGAAGEVIMVNANTLFTYSINSTSTWAAGTTPFNGPPSIIAAHYVPGAGAAAGYYLVNNNGSGTSAIGKAATLAAVAAAPTLQNVPITAAAHITEAELASNGSIICLAAVDDAGVAAIYRSANGGTLWTTVGAIAGATHVNIVWSDYHQLFIVWADNGNVYTSADGITFATIRGGLTLAAAGFRTGRGTFQVVGCALVKSTATGSSAGIAYSFDLGATWFYWYITDGASGSGTMALQSINNRVYAIDSSGVVLFRSGLLAAPTVAEI